MAEALILDSEGAQRFGAADKLPRCQLPRALLGQPRALRLRPRRVCDTSLSRSEGVLAPRARKTGPLIWAAMEHEPGDVADANARDFRTIQVSAGRGTGIAIRARETSCGTRRRKRLGSRQPSIASWVVFASF